jgi:hypothetical protein
VVHVSDSDNLSDNLSEYAAEIPSTPYARVLETHAGQDYIDRLTRIFEDIGAAQWLERNPLSCLELTQTVLDEFKEEVNGMYSFKSSAMQVATTRSKSEYGQLFEWGSVYSVSSTGELPIDAVQRTLIHELGHHIHKVLLELNPELFDRTVKVAAILGGTRYAKTHWREYFAENFALYVFYPTELLVKDEAGYGMMEQALSAVGLEVKQK